MKRILKMLCIICLMMCGCAKQNQPNTIISSLNDVKVDFLTNITCNNAIPLTFASRKEIGDLKIRLKSENPLKFGHDISIVDYENNTAKISDKEPWFVWASKHDFDWNKQKEAYKIQKGEIEKQKEWEAYLLPFTKKYEDIKEKNEIFKYVIYDGYIYIEDLFASDNNQITQIQICDGNEVLKEIEVDINISTVESDDSLNINTGHALLGDKTFPSFYQVYVNDFSLYANKDVTLKKIVMYDENLKIEQLQMKIDGEEYLDISSDDINLRIKKGSKVIVRPEVRTYNSNEDSIYTRNYIYCMQYEENGVEKEHYFDSGVISSWNNYDQLYYLQTGDDYSDYLECILSQETFNDSILIE